MPRTPASYEKYLSDFRALEERVPANGPGWLREMREQGIASFSALGFPTATKGNERWKYTNVTPVANATFEYPVDVDADAVSLTTLQETAPWDDGWTRLVFVDGVFSRALSTGNWDSNGLRSANLTEVLNQDGDHLVEHLGQHALADEDAFTAVNTAFLRDGAAVYVPNEGSPESALHLLFVTTARPAPTVSYPRTLIVAGRNSKLTVLESYVGPPDGAYFTNAVAEIVAEEGAQIEHYRYLSESAHAFHIGTTRVHQERDSTFSSTSFARGARLARNDLNVLLDAPGASCTLNGLYTTSGTQHIDNHINVDHARPHTSSNQYFKGILDGHSRAVFSGRVLIRKDAQKTYARQSDKNLLLSEGARVNTKPSLEIFADDVQAFHGATAGAMAQDAIFYMRSRGLDAETAQKILIYGFASEIIERVKLEPLREHMNRLFQSALPTLQNVVAP